MNQETPQSLRFGVSERSSPPVTPEGTIDTVYSPTAYRLSPNAIEFSPTAKSTVPTKSATAGSDDDVADSPTIKDLNKGSMPDVQFELPISESATASSSTLSFFNSYQQQTRTIVLKGFRYADIACGYALREILSVDEVECNIMFSRTDGTYVYLFFPNVEDAVVAYHALSTHHPLVNGGVRALFISNGESNRVINNMAMYAPDDLLDTNPDLTQLTFRATKEFGTEHHNPVGIEMLFDLMYFLRQFGDFRHHWVIEHDNSCFQIYLNCQSYFQMQAILNWNGTAPARISINNTGYHVAFFHVSQSNNRHRSNAFSPRRPRCNGINTTIDIAKIERFEEFRTTVMIRNIPNEMDFATFKNWMDNGSRGQFDFLYNRIDYSTGRGVGYAFVNFVDPDAVVNFFRRVNGRSWPGFPTSRKEVALAFATQQGVEVLVEHFRNSSVRLEHPDYRPKLFYVHGDPYPAVPGEEKDFPPPNNYSKLQRSIENARVIGLFHGGNANRARRSFDDQYDRGTPQALRHQALRDMDQNAPNNLSPIGTGRYHASVSASHSFRSQFSNVNSGHYPSHGRFSRRPSPTYVRFEQTLGYHAPQGRKWQSRR